MDMPPGRRNPSETVSKRENCSCCGKNATIAQRSGELLISRSINRFHLNRDSPDALGCNIRPFGAFDEAEPPELSAVIAARRVLLSSIRGNVREYRQPTRHLSQRLPVDDAIPQALELWARVAYVLREPQRRRGLL